MNELAKAGQTLPSVENDAWGAEGASNQDILIPRVNLMQDISDLVKKGKAKSGDIVNSVTNEVLAEARKSMELIPITTFREWLNYEVTVDRSGKQKLTYIGKTRMTPDNENWPVNDEEGGKRIQRVKAINFFVLLPTKLDELPFLVSFRKSSIQAGKRLSTHFQMSAMKKAPPAKQVFTLSSMDKTFDTHNFFAYDVEPARVTNPEELKVARKWYDVLKQADVKVQDDQEEVPNF